MPVKNTGVITARDHFITDFTDGPIEKRVAVFLDSGLSDEEVKRQLDLNENYAWRVSEARKQLGKVKNPNSLLTDFLYRPFDKRRILYDKSVVWRTRDGVMRNMLGGKNFGLITTRLTKDKWGCFVTDAIMGHKTLAAYDINYLFPAFILDSSASLGENQGLFSVQRPNFRPEFLRDLAKRIDVPQEEASHMPVGLSVEDITGYAYAIFHSSGYQNRYSEFLKRDFPRLPLPSDLNLFLALGQKGCDLISLHLLKSDCLDKFVTTFPVKGDSVVEKVEYKPESQQVSINALQYFGGVQQNIWETFVGGYQVCEKWLKDRKGRKLSYDDVQYWQRIVVAISETMRLIKEIDALIPGWPLP